MVSTGAALLITTVVLLAGSARTQAQDLNVTRYVAIGRQSVVRLPVQVPVKLDCRPLAVLTFGNELNLSSIMWTHNENVIRDNDTVRNVLLSPNNLCLLLSELKIKTGAEDGTEALITCTACRNDPPGRVCQDFSTRIIANSPPVLPCDDPPRPVPPSGFGNLNFGCDMCVERGQAVTFLTLDCTPDTKRLPTNCTIRSPEGITAEDLDDGAAFVSANDQLTITNLIMNPESTDPPVVLGTWTCTCMNSDGTTTAMSRIGSCLIPPKIDKGRPKMNITDFPPYLSEGGRTFKIGGNDFVITGNRFFILCNIIEGNPPPGITWTRDGVPLPSFDNMTSIPITVNKTDPEAAAGRYMCTAMNAAGSDDAVSVMRVGLEIFEPPVIKRGPRVDPPTNVSIGDKDVDIGSDVYVIRGSGVTIRCDLDRPGLPRGEITWTRNGRPFSDAMLMEFISNMGTRLQFASTNDSSEAYYCCKAENLAGADEACSSVFLRGGGPNIRKGFMFPRPVNPELVTLSERITTDIGGSAYATVGAEVVVMCPVTFAEPDVTAFMWMFTNAAGTSFPINPTFTTTNPMTGEMSGMVTVDGDVEITVFQNIPLQTSRIVINSNRTGYEVTCVATSPLGMDNATTNFAAYAPPVINPEGTPSILPPEVPTGSRTQNIGSTFHMVSGGDLTVNCPSTGAIPPGSEDYAWYYQGKLIMDQTNFTDMNMNMIGKFLITTSGGMSTLTIRNVSRGSNGEVQCTVFNPAGSDVSSSRVRVYSDVLIAKGPNITIGPEENTGTIGNKFFLPRGKRAYINCGFAETGGFPYNESVSLPALIEWSFNGVPVDPDLFSQLHGNQLCVDLALFNLTGNDNFQCKSTSRITDGVMRQMDSATSNVMLVDGPVIDRDALPDALPNRKRLSFGSGVNRVIVAGTDVDIRCQINATMPPSTLVWSVDTGDGGVEISSALNPKYTLTGSGTTLDLAISNFGIGEVGCYSCNSENNVGMDNARVCLNLCPDDSSTAPCNVSATSFMISLPQEHPEDLCPFCAFYFLSPYGPCVPPCHAGNRNRIVECFAGSRVIDLDVCANRSTPFRPVPSSTQNCSNVFVDDARSCLLEPKWMVGPWSMCTRTCEGGIQTRQVMCRIPASGKLVPDYKCAAISLKPITWRKCYKYIPCGCEDYSASCKYIGGSRCLQRADFLTCCKTCSQGRPVPYGGG